MTALAIKPELQNGWSVGATLTDHDQIDLLELGSAGTASDQTRETSQALPSAADVAALLAPGEAALSATRARALILLGTGGSPQQLALALAASKLGMTLAVSPGPATSPHDPPQLHLEALLADLIICSPAQAGTYAAAGLEARTTVIEDQADLSAVTNWVEAGAPRASRSPGGAIKAAP